MRNLLISVLLAGVALPVAAAAQSSVEGRVGRLESEMRAVQRKVFPGGAGGQLVQPDITAPVEQTPALGAPATSAVADLTQRVAALEGQMATLTGQIEQQGYKTRQLQDAFDAYKRATDTRLSAMEGSGAAPIAGAPAVGGTLEEEAPPPRTGRPARPAPVTAAAPAGEEDDSGGQATTVQRPSTGDAAEDGYLYGYRLWQAKQYPAAEAQLEKVVASYPKHRRASFAQNLLGRAYLDDGKPSLASMAFYDNYKKMPDGERAPDSLYYLAQALVRLKKPADACKVYGELTDVYAGKISATMQADIAKGRVAAKCQ